ncbi:hypothetical protein LTR70_008860 [Exophiala xenobiotica]|uniref:Uncharacterized protein n=1 Tax=Lithohypha guttulata TaxID=1690604 RepID=A0ABR0K009_9EURO|nr:hypothetical protein LTR24_008522 [Lithohypha guttulata]KAK5311324.1 hypothetical protein LTR70_008860 [Exophiala xenobiotica]
MEPHPALTIALGLYDIHVYFLSQAQEYSQKHIPTPETTLTMKFNVLLTVAGCLSGMLVTATPMKTGVHEEKRDAMVEQIEKLEQAKKTDVWERCCTSYRNVSVCEGCSGRKEESKQVVERAKDERCCVTSGMVSVCHECPSEEDAEHALDAEASIDARSINPANVLLRGTGGAADGWFVYCVDKEDTELCQEKGRYYCNSRGKVKQQTPNDGKIGYCDRHCRCGNLNPPPLWTCIDYGVGYGRTCYRKGSRLGN